MAGVGLLNTHQPHVICEKPHLYRLRQTRSHLHNTHPSSYDTCSDIQHFFCSNGASVEGQLLHITNEEPKSGKLY